ncbi:MAG: holo-ACP synthase [Desulfobulbaceae bacterium]|nr:MAG: holo-ACP synthase [Desulfobulbaceae bacterium]
MIYGIGADIVNIGRIKTALTRHGDLFAQRILALGEWEEYQILARRNSQQRAAFLARRFAAKEATVKAFGTGFRDGIKLTSIAVIHDQRGRPNLHFSAEAREYCQTQGITKSFLSLADEKDYAVAFVTLLHQT